MAAFDPYHQWLGIPAQEQPPNHFRLLGLRVGESDASVIESAVSRQTTFVRQFQSGQHENDASRLLNEIAEAGEVLLDAGERATYVRSLQPAPAAAEATAATAAGPGPRLRTAPSPQSRRPAPRPKRRGTAAPAAVRPSLRDRSVESTRPAPVRRRPRSMEEDDRPIPPQELLRQQRPAGASAPRKVRRSSADWLPVAIALGLGLVLLGGMAVVGVVVWGQLKADVSRRPQVADAGDGSLPDAVNSADAVGGTGAAPQQATPAAHGEASFQWPRFAAELTRIKNDARTQIEAEKVRRRNAPGPPRNFPGRPPWVTEAAEKAFLRHLATRYWNVSHRRYLDYVGDRRGEAVDADDVAQLEDFRVRGEEELASYFRSISPEATIGGTTTVDNGGRSGAGGSDDGQDGGNAVPPPPRRPEVPTTGDAVTDGLALVATDDLWDVRKGLEKLAQAPVEDGRRGEVLDAAMPMMEPGERHVKEALPVVVRWDDGRVVDRLLKIVADDTIGLSRRGPHVLALGELGDRRAARPLSFLLADFFLKDEARKALNRLGPAAEKELQEWFLEKTPLQTRLHIIRALGLFGTQASVEFLNDWRSRGEFRKDVADALEQIGRRG